LRKFSISNTLFAINLIEKILNKKILNKKILNKKILNNININVIADDTERSLLLVP